MKTAIDYLINPDITEIHFLFTPDDNYQDKILTEITPCDEDALFVMDNFPSELDYFMFPIISHI
ncbi:hypothetical protein XBO1_1040005 [Xenorhabdus bovienii str. oregonense]|uniref:Uncharacterized protein n=1 Tax=Xenorhabdus bovienii str. oregonense TaxID=1398202 RepID=A0A077NPS0_XENBV|nr:hypothetical protein XBO1_1040005 [Xenorhabdus bovienii str. oregonense]